MSNTLGEFLRKRRMEGGGNLSLRAAAELIGVSHSTLSEIERGLRRPDLETLVNISAAYNVPLDILVSLAASDAGLSKVTQDSTTYADRAALLAGMAQSFPALGMIVEHLLALPPSDFRGVLTYLELLRKQRETG